MATDPTDAAKTTARKLLARSEEEAIVYSISRRSSCKMVERIVDAIMAEDVDVTIDRTNEHQGELVLSNGSVIRWDIPPSPVENRKAGLVIIDEKSDFSY